MTRKYALGAALLFAAAAPVFADREEARLGSEEGVREVAAAPEHGPADLHPLFAPSPEQVEAAARFGTQSRRARKTVEEVLECWSFPVPEAEGKVVVMVPAARVAAAAYEAAKMHKNEVQKRKAIEEALAKNRENIVFQVWLESRGSGTWLWPYNAKPGDREALESIGFVLSDGKGRYYQPIDPDAGRQVEGKARAVGSPIVIAVYTRVKDFFFSLPLLASRQRTDFVARYEVAFPLYDPESHRPIFDKQAKSFSLKIIGARSEKEVRFSLAALEKIPGQGDRNLSPKS